MSALKFAANLSWLYTELPFLDRFAAAARDGFTGVECLFPHEHPTAEIQARLSDLNLQLVLFNAEFGQHHDVLGALCLSAVSLAFFGPGSWLLMIGGGERYFLIGRAILFVLYLGLLYGLAQVLGLMGIAIAGLAMNVASNLIATHWVMRRWRIDNMATAFLKPFLLFDARRRSQGDRPTRASRRPIALREGNGEASA